MKIRNLPLCAMGIVFLASLIVVPVGASAEEKTNSLTKQVMSGSKSTSRSESLKKEVQVTNTEKKKSEVQIDLGDQLKAYVAEGESPYGKDLDGKPLRGRYRTTFGFHIPL